MPIQSSPSRPANATEPDDRAMGYSYVADVAAETKPVEPITGRAQLAQRLTDADHIRGARLVQSH